MGCAHSKEVIKIDNNNKNSNEIFNENNEINNDDNLQRGKTNYTTNKYSNNKNLNEEDINDSNELLINIDEINSNYNILYPIYKNEISIDYKIQSKNNPKLFQILKVIDKNKIGKSIPEEKIVSEIKILNSLKNKSIIQVYDCFYDNKNYYIITELCELGNLYSLMKKTKKFTENQIKYIIFQILNAVKYLCEKNFVHTDIKPNNIYINKIVKIKNENFYKVKLLDFASSNSINNNNTDNSNLPYYISPEIFEQNYNYKCDIWSIGIILYEMLFGYTPFHGYNYETLVFNIKNSDINFENSIISENALNLLKKMLVRDINQRYDSEQCLQHIWFRNIKEFEKEENNINDSLHSLVQIKNEEKKSFFSKKFNKDICNSIISSSDFQSERNNNLNKTIKLKEMCKNIKLEIKGLNIKRTFSIKKNENKKFDLQFINQNIRFIHHYIRKKFFLIDEIKYLKQFFDKYKKDEKINFENTIFSFKKYCGIEYNLENDFVFNEKIINKLKEKYYHSELNIFEFQNFLVEFKGEIIEETLWKLFINFNGNNKRDIMNCLNKNKSLKYKKYFLEINQEMKKQKLKENYLFFEYKALLEKIINKLNLQ